MTGCLAKPVRRALGVGMIMAMLTLSIAQAASPAMNAAGNAANASRNAEEPPPTLGPLSTAEKQGYGCLVAGGAALAVTAVVGAPDILALFTGATALPATNPLGVGLAVAGTAFASICAVGALVAPTALRLWSYYVDGAEIVQKP